MKVQPSTFVRIWKKSPRLAIAYVRRQMGRKAKALLPGDEWNGGWLGEEMRPYNSLHS
jgi:hypothetical protein